MTIRRRVISLWHLFRVLLELVRLKEREPRIRNERPNGPTPVRLRLQLVRINYSRPRRRIDRKCVAERNQSIEKVLDGMCRRTSRRSSDHYGMIEQGFAM